MARPRILIPVPTSFDEAYNQQCWPEFATAVQDAGGDAVPLPLTHSARELEALAADADGILLPGSPADMDPARYGHERNEATAVADALRVATDFVLLEAAERTGKPLLGICMGLQTMNTYYGGTLIQDLDPLPVNHSAGRAVQAAHTALVTPGSRLHGIVATLPEFAEETDGAGRVPVNSSHHQAIDALGEALLVTARCRQDGVIEAVEGADPDHWLMGVQWHPERTLSSGTASLALFRAFIAACSQRA